MNSNWPRWIKASIYSAFNTWNQGLGTPYPLFAEGQDRKTNQFDHWLELRMDGPTIEEYTAGFFKLTVEINIVCTCKVGENEDLYHIDRMTGDVASFFTNTLPVYELGDDPAIQIGCLQLTTLGGENILIRQYGQIEAKTELMQAVVAAKYFIEIP